MIYQLFTSIFNFTLTQVRVSYTLVRDQQWRR